MKVNISSDVKNVIKSIDRDSAKLDRTLKGIVDELLNKGLETAKLNFNKGNSYNSDTLIHDIHLKKDDTYKGHIVAGRGNTEQIMRYIEYGTGYVGKQNKHPEYKDVGWEYDRNNHGKSGWVYPADSHSHTKGITFEAKSGDLLAWTRGRKANRFMYFTHKSLNKKASILIAQRLLK